jgi:hypothetical protein
MHDNTSKSWPTVVKSITYEKLCYQRPKCYMKQEYLLQCISISRIHYLIHNDLQWFNPWWQHSTFTWSSNVRRFFRRDEPVVWCHFVSTVASDRIQPGCTGTLTRTLHQTGGAAKTVLQLVLTHSWCGDKRVTLHSEKVSMRSSKVCTNNISLIISINK